MTHEVCRLARELGRRSRRYLGQIPVSFDGGESVLELLHLIVHFQHLLAVVFRLRTTLGPPHRLVKLPVSGLLHPDFIGQVPKLRCQLLLSLHRVLHLLLV